jgi:hypothetical protein
VQSFTLDPLVDIQEVAIPALVSIPEPSMSKRQARWVSVENESVIGYSLYRQGMRVNDEVITALAYSTPDEVSLRPVIRGGYETVYGSDGVQNKPDKTSPPSFAFSVVPNPFVKLTRIDYTLPEQILVEIVIYDVSGRKVKMLVSETKNPGYYSTIWNGTDDTGREVSSGVYFVRLESNGLKLQEKILLLK